MLLRLKIKWPIGGKETIIRVEPAYYERLLKYLPNDYLNLSTVYEVLNNPNRIFSGLNRPHSDSSNMLCVAGRPQHWYIGKKSSSKVPFPPELVYLVFLSARKSVYEFRAEQADAEDSLCPVNWKNRFGKVIWKRN